MAVSGVTINGDGTATWLITAEDSATFPKGPISTSLKLWRPFIPRINDLYGYWPLEEAAGNSRVKLLGTAASADLPEENGAVATAAGKFGTYSVQSDPADNHWLRTTALDPTFGLSTGLTVALWVYLDSYVGAASNLCAISNGGTYVVFFDRYANNLYAELKTPSRQVVFTDVSLDAWHLLIGRYDPVSRVWSAQLDDAAPVTTTALSAAEEANYAGLFSLGLTNVWHGGFVRFPGRADALMVWNVALAQNEIDSLYTNPNPVETASGDIQSQDSSTTLATTPATWTTASGLTLTLSESTLTQGDAFSSVLTATDAAGDTVDLTGWRIYADLSYDPQGSETAIQLQLPTRVIVSGEIRYTDYASGTSPRPTPIWAGVTVSLFDSTSALLATTITDAAGLYQFVGTVAEGTDVYVSVTAQLPPGEALNENKTGSTFTVALGVNVVNLVCDRAPI